jgi:hypothetical protein
MRSYSLIRYAGICFAVLLLAPNTRAQSPSDDAVIKQLILDLENHSISPGRALDPAVTGRTRAKDLDELSDPHFELTLTAKGEIVFSPDGTAHLDADVHFSDQTSEMSNTDGTVHFVERQGRWYFANYDFLKVPFWFWPLGIIMCGFAIASAVVMLRCWRQIREARRARQPAGAQSEAIRLAREVAGEVDG